MAEVKRLFVAAGGRRRGVGAALLAHLEREAADRGYGRAVLTTGDRQPEALALYAAAGRTELSREANKVRLGERLVSGAGGTAPPASR